MINPLPVDTVFEAKRRSRKETTALFSILIAIYIVIFNFMSIVVLIIWRIAERSERFEIENIAYGNPSWNRPLITVHEAIPIVLYTTLIAIVVAVIHFIIARNESTSNIVKYLGGQKPDPSDEYHSRFINIVEEAEIATGIRPIEPVVLSNMGANAFAVQDGKNRCAIGVTEGLLSKLDRSELTAVISHEAAHLLHEDSKLATTACSLSQVFAIISRALSEFNQYRFISFRKRGGGNAVLFILLAQVCLWTLATVGYGITSLLRLAISRNREYLADAHGAEMCKDPLSLAQALDKISHSSRGGFRSAQDLSTIFIMNPNTSALDETEGAVAELFSTHPPAKERINRLLKWAKADLSLLKSEQKPEVAAISQPVGDRAFYHRAETGWKGPMSPAELIVQGLVNPQAMVSPADQDEIQPAANYADLVRELENAQNIEGLGAKEKCPRCNTGLHEIDYEGTQILHCKFCDGHLLKGGHLERLIARRDQTFTEEEIQNAKNIWLASQKGSIKDACKLPYIKCPLCNQPMIKSFHTLHTRVVIDRCTNPNCGAVWCDKGELAMIQILVENATALLTK